MPVDHFRRFPDGFVWGTATSAYQIEGACDEDGRGPSIWDTFCGQPGKIYRGENGQVAADHYHRFEEDLQLMTELGVSAYRFSIAWPRILPAGKGAVNLAGLDFYDRLVDSLLARGIQPYITLFHWDLPQALQETGGWTDRSTAGYFAEYAHLVASRLGDRVKAWITHNEPASAALAGHFLGEHAPGLQDPIAALQAAKNILLSHGLAVEALRAVLPPDAQVGITLNLSPIHPASDSEADRAAARRADLVINRLFLDPVLRGCFPEEILDLFGPLFANVDLADSQRMGPPIDFLGVNYYTRTVIRHDPDFPLVNFGQVQPEGSEYSQMWEIYPQGTYELLEQIWNEYHPAQIFITENGIPVADGPDFDGRVRDERRIRYLHDHLVQVHRALLKGIPVRGYFVWSLLDNFEWAFGYSKRFGLVYIDFDTQKRSMKDSGRWYAEVIRANGLNPDLNQIYMPG